MCIRDRIWSENGKTLSVFLRRVRTIQTENNTQYALCKMQNAMHYYFDFRVYSTMDNNDSLKSNTVHLVTNWDTINLTVNNTKKYISATGNWTPIWHATSAHILTIKFCSLALTLYYINLYVLAYPLLKLDDMMERPLQVQGGFDLIHINLHISFLAPSLYTWGFSPYCCKGREGDRPY